jgi:hypothetical protein
MSLSIVVNGGGTFTASMEEGPVSFTASLAAVGPKGDTGPGVAVGGTTGQVLAKASGTNYDTQWVARNPFDQDLNTTDTVNFGEVRIPSPDNHAKLTNLMWRPFSNAYGDNGVEYLGDKVVFADDTEQTTALPTGTDDGNIVEWDADTSTYVSVPNDARTLFITARNITGTTIPKGSVVLITGASGNRPTIGLAQGNTSANADGVLGITAAAINNNANGRVITEGLASNLDTSAFAAGDKLYLSAVTPGGLVNVRPVQPAHSVAIGVVTRSNATVGSIEVRVHVGEHLEYLHDVLLTSNTNLDLLSYESSSGLWKNKSFSTLGLLTSATAASTYLTTSTAASTYAPLASPTFTGTVTIPAGASISGFAPLASPALTGTPTAPTAAATTNTTQVATTAFVQQEVPAASTTAAGKVELATDAEANDGSSTVLGITPATLSSAIMQPGKGMLSGASSIGLTSGTGASTNGSFFGVVCIGPDSGVTGYGTRRFQANDGQVPSLGKHWGVVNFTNRITMSARVTAYVTGAGTVSNDSVLNVNYGDLLGTDTGGNLARKGFGIQIYGDNAMRLTVHNGTTLTNVASTFTPVKSDSAAQAFDFKIISENGTVTLYVRTSMAGGWSQVATSTAGPTGDSAQNAMGVTFSARNESNVTTPRWRMISGFLNLEY